MSIRSACVFLTTPEATHSYTYLHTLSRRHALPIWRLDVPAGSGGASGRSTSYPAGRPRPDRLTCSDNARDHRRISLGIPRCKNDTHDQHRLHGARSSADRRSCRKPDRQPGPAERSEEHTSELQSLMRISYAVFCLKKKK